MGRLPETEDGPMIEKKTVASEILKLNEAPALSEMEYSANVNSRSATPGRTLSDDLIRTLAEAYENKRARQVLEWDRLRRTRSWAWDS